MYHIRRFCLYVAKGGRTRESTTLFHKAFERPSLVLAERSLLENTLHLCAVRRHPALSWWVLGLCPPFESDAAWQVRVPTAPFTPLPLFPLSSAPSQGHMAPLPLIFITEDMHKKRKNKEVQEKLTPALFFFV